MNNILDQHQGEISKELSRDFFKSVYSYMFGALAISGIVAYLTGTPEFFVKYFMKADLSGVSPIFWVVTFAPVGLALLIQTMYQRLSYPLLLLLFGGYAVLMGLSLSGILLVYSGAQVATTLLITAGAFGGMAILGYTTSTDLTKMGSLLYMLFIGIFIASIVNIWMESEGLDFIISFIGVFVFTGLTAYFMQQLKSTAQNQMLSAMDRSKMALVGGLILYILFVNLFMSLLNLLGRD